MGLRIGGGFGFGPFGVGTSFRVGGGRRGGSSGDDLAPLVEVFLWIIAILFAICVTILFGILFAFFSIGFLVAHLAKSDGLKSSNRRPWVSRILLCLGALAVIYLFNRGGLGSAWSNFDFGSHTDKYSSQSHTWSDDWRLLFELCLWSFALGLVLSTPVHWAICENHRPNKTARRLARETAIKKHLGKYGDGYLSVLLLPGLPLLVWMLIAIPDVSTLLLVLLVLYGVCSGFFYLLHISLFLFKMVDLLINSFSVSFDRPEDLQIMQESLDLLESLEIDPEIYLELTPGHRRHVDNWARQPSETKLTPRQQKEIIDNFLKNQRTSKNQRKR